ncbi:hypothetical protein [Aeromicrobium sp. UC242_57]|uniref:hypothetical protein n=1 Tax=Aeromicrobium sp. UC242_57 TaxID=3374624 RepID=UPI0037B73490
MGLGDSQRDHDTESLAQTSGIFDRRPAHDSGDGDLDDSAAGLQLVEPTAHGGGVTGLDSRHDLVEMEWAQQAQQIGDLQPLDLTVGSQSLRLGLGAFDDVWIEQLHAARCAQQSASSAGSRVSAAARRSARGVSPS